MVWDKRTVLWASISAMLYLSMTLSSWAQARATDISQYDLGYAHKAAQDCPQLVLRVNISNDDLVSPDFVRGAAMVTQQTKQIGLELVCQFAINLYDSETGKVAKLLRKSP